MTKVYGRRDLSPALGNMRSNLRGLQQRQTQYIIDPTTGSALAILGDLFAAPVNSFSLTAAQMAETGLGHVWGFGVYVSPLGTAEPNYVSGGTWVQLPGSGGGDPWQLATVSAVYYGSPNTVDLMGSTSFVPCLESYNDPTPGDYVLVGVGTGGPTDKVVIGVLTSTLTDPGLINAAFTLTATGTVSPPMRSALACVYDSTADLTYAIDGFGGATHHAGDGTLLPLTAYNYSGNSWVIRAFDPTERTWSGAAYDSSANLTYAADGYTGPNVSLTPIDTLNAYSHGSNAWTNEANDSFSRAGIGAAFDSTADLTYAVDGYDGSSTFFHNLTAYSHGSNSWTSEANDTIGRQNIGCAYDNNANITYAFGGYDGSVSLKTLTAYSHGSNSWTAETSISFAIEAIAAAYDSSASLFYEIDGANGAAIDQAVTAYSHGSNSWTSEANDTVTRDEVAAAYDSAANLTFAVDGDANVAQINITTAYSHTSNTWTTEATDIVG